MKKIILCIVTLLFLACSDKKEAAPVAPEAASGGIVLTELKHALGETFSVTEINRMGTVDGLPFQKMSLDSSGSVVIKADDGTEQLFRKYVNPEDETESYSYSLIGLEPKTGLYCVAQELWEEQKFFLVRKANGRQYEIANEPVISTDGKWLFVKQNDCFRMFDDCPTGFTVYSLNRGGVELFREAKLSNYYVDRGGFQANGKLAVCLKAIDGKDEKEYYFEISPKGGFR